MNIYKVISQSEPVTITKQDGTQTQKSTIVLQELGNQYADSYAAVLVGQPTPNREQSNSFELPRCEGGKDAQQINQIKFAAGDLVVAALRFTSHEYNGQHYQDCTIQDVRKLT